MTQLTEKEEKLLEQYFDGECRLFAGRKAKRLLDEKPEALAYIEHLKELSKATKKAISEEYTGEVDLWDRISNRIDQEEYASIFLGERKTLKEEKVPWYSGIGWAIPGAALSAFAFFMVSSQPVASLPGGSPKPLGFAEADFLSLQSLRTVSQGALQQAPQQRVVPRAYVRRSVPVTSVVEVDWMRSDGRVRLIEDPEDTGAIIWIRRRKPTSKAIPLAGARNSNGIQVIEDNVPDALIVGGSE